MQNHWAMQVSQKQRSTDFSGINLALIGKGNRKERFEQQVNAFKTQGYYPKKRPKIFQGL